MSPEFPLAALLTTDDTPTAEALEMSLSEGKQVAVVVSTSTPSHADEPCHDASDADRVVHLCPEPPTVATPWRSRKEVISRLAGRVVDEQKGINVLQALRWDPSVEEAFRSGRARELPPVDEAHWDHVELGFDPVRKIEGFEQIATDVVAELGANDDLGSILRETALQYRDVVKMLCGRGTPEFYRYSRELYGSTKDVIGSVGSVRQLGLRLYDALSRVSGLAAVAPQPRTMSAEEAATMLADRIAHFLPEANVRVLIDPDLLADATAGADYVKLRQGARFSEQDLGTLEAHEVWVHLATTINGQAQPVARWLAKGPPRTSATQEGLAVLMELLTQRCPVHRARKVCDRIIAVDKAEDGAGFLDVYEWLRTEGYAESECFSAARRVFRGGVLGGGAPFTKDIAYGKGLAQNIAFVLRSVGAGHLDHIPMLFAGKLALDDVAVLSEHVGDGLVKPPTYVPAVFSDVSTLASSVAMLASVFGDGHDATF